MNAIYVFLRAGDRNNAQVILSDDGPIVFDGLCGTVVGLDLMPFMCAGGVELSMSRWHICP